MVIYSLQLEAQSPGIHDLELELTISRLVAW